jgi:fructoselysine-6-P-deglycase FrlB-like protein
MHVPILEHLGADLTSLKAVLEADFPVAIERAGEALRDCDVVVFAGRHVMQGIAQSGALSMMELCRVPTIGFETGQFRHGPYEFLRPGLGVILLRGAGRDKDIIPSIAATTVDAGCTTIIFDASAEAPLEGCITIELPKNNGLAAGMNMLLAFQHLNIFVAKDRITAGIGSPLRTTKVTI